MANINALLRFAAQAKPASELQHLQQKPKFPPLYIPNFNAFYSKGLVRGGIIEINGLRSSGKTSAFLHILAQSSSASEICAIVDLNNCFHPHSAAAAGVDLDRLVWVQCKGNLEHAMRSVDLLLHAGGFGLVLLDLCEAPLRALQRIPISFWHRFRRVIEHTPTILLICADSLQAKSCANQALQIKSKTIHWSGHASFQLLHSVEVVATPHKTTHSKITSIRPESLLLTA